MEQNYVINTNAPQTQRRYSWKKSHNKEWFIDNIFCCNCNCSLSSKLPLAKFCSNCGFMIINSQNPDPPEED